MGSEVVRVDKETARAIKELQRQIVRETGEWISQAEALRRLMSK